MSTFRITTNGLFRGYRSNLMKNTKRLQDTITDVQTQRKFNTYAEDPAAASQAWRLRRSYWRTEDQIDNNNYIISKYESAYSAMGAIIDGTAENPGLDGLLASIEGLSDSAGTARYALGRELISTSESIVSMMNTKYGDDFVFAGADGANIPFSWEGDVLLYRGVNVNLQEPRSLEDCGFDDATLDKYNLTSPAQPDYGANSGKTDVESATLEQPLTMEKFKESAYYDATDTTKTDDEKYAAYKVEYLARNQDPTNGYVQLTETDPEAAFDEASVLYTKLSAFQKYASNYAENNHVDSLADGIKQYQKLQDMVKETTYIDIGLGLQEDIDGEFITGSAFNSSISGLEFSGYGKDKNLAVLLRELGGIFERTDRKTGAYANEEDAGRASQLLDLVHDSIRNAQGMHVKLSADANYIKTNLKQLETNRAELNEQIMDTESMDAAEAITEMTWAQYCYNAALRIGTNLLSQSLIDYLS
ncbi:MAG: hypothetical protein E7425_13160 [Ruminococcaceae bacterium]|jgi:flagellin-like hook-associated protein FlgL|nr:hypothetical protein [Oscillospiraceae bacterium]